MAVILGKRKRQKVALEEKVKQPTSDSGDDDATARALFQKAFEAKFKPLEGQPVKQQEESKDEGFEDESAEESDFSGFEQDEDEVEVIEHAQPDMDAIFSGLKNGKKSYMSSKPPTSEDSQKVTRASAATLKKKDHEHGTEATNLKNDLALQRLLKESHLLDSSTFSSSTAPEGRSRIKALDMRIQDLGSKSSSLQQDKMPMSHRKGIASKAASRETARRKEAAENGIILERAKAKEHPRMQKRKRELGVDGPGVGRMRGGTLKLSSKDIRNIEGSKARGKGRKR